MNFNNLIKEELVFETYLVKFEIVKDGDIKIVTDLRNKFRDNFFNDQIITLEQSKKWHEKLIFPKEVLLAIKLKFNSKIIGTIGWSNLSRKDNSAEFGRLIIDYRYALKYITTKEARILSNNIYNDILNFGFNKIQLDKIYTKSKASNYKSITLQKKIGFDGIKKESFLIFCITKDKWKEK